MRDVFSVRGVSPVLAVPFTNEGDVDASSFQALVRHVLASGASSAMLFGFASEFYKLTDDERTALLSSFIKETSARRDFVTIASVTDHATEIAVRRAKASVLAGAGAL